MKAVPILVEHNFISILELLLKRTLTITLTSNPLKYIMRRLIIIPRGFKESPLGVRLSIDVPSIHIFDGNFSRSSPT
jgi:hypothetical protein